MRQEVQMGTILNILMCAAGTFVACEIWDVSPASIGLLRFILGWVVAVSMVDLGRYINRRLDGGV